ncbi:MAG: RDD family protein [Terracidiphilus sp.]
MSKSATSATLFPAWKQEVNRRVAAHMSRKTPSTNESGAAQDGRPTRGSRAAQAAARVAERYAQAPSYSELLADEARNAMRAAEVASEAAQQAQAAVQYVLDGLEAAAAPELVPHSESEAANAPVSQLLDERSPFSAAKRTEQARRLVEHVDDPQAPAPLEASAEAFEDSRSDDAGVPIYANLIQFPRLMVATRRMRPRRAEGPLADAPAQSQLSIFEVDPASISTEAAPAIDEPATPVWMRAEESSSEFEPQSEEQALEESRPRATQGSIKLAPLNLRLMALVIDASLILAVCLSLALLLVSRAGHLPGPSTVELVAGLAVLAIGAAYQALFVVLAHATPGMRYAGVTLSTFEGQLPGRAQRSMRVAALLLSVLPLGLGLVWALFDDDHLMGHDRLSKTYLRKR